MDQSCQRVHLVLAQRGIQTFTSSTLPISFLHQDVSLDAFIFEAFCWFLIILKYDLHIGIGIVRGQKWQK